MTRKSQTIFRWITLLRLGLADREDKEKVTNHLQMDNPPKAYFNYTYYFVELQHDF